MKQETASLTLTVKSVGTKNANGTLTVTADHITDLTKVTEEADKVKVTDSKGAEIAGAKVESKTITIPVTATEGGTAVTITNLPLYGEEAGGVTPQVVYTISTGGNFIAASEAKTDAEYYTVYQNAKGQELNTSKGKYTFSIEEDTRLTVKNIYSAVTVSASGEEKGSAEFPGMKFTVTTDTNPKCTVTATADKAGKAVIKGLPAGNYTITGDVAAIPAVYHQQKKSAEVKISESSPAVTAALTYKQMILTLKAVDSRTKKAISGAEIQIAKKDGSDKKTVKTNEKGEAILTGYLERGMTYKIKQNRVSGYFDASSSQLKSSEYTVKSEGEDPVITFSSQPTVLKVGVIDDVSETSPYRGSYIKNATVEIREGNKVIKTITTESQPVEVVGVLDPNVKYQVVQTAAPAGYIIGAVNESGSYSIGKYATIKSKAGKSVNISADTVKVLISRKGYDSRKQVTKNGKKSYEYTNLKFLSGAKMEIHDKDGNVVKDQNGNPVSWTSDENGGHLVEAVLAANTEYTLVETSAPDGYDAAGKGNFHTYKSGNKAAVTMQTRKASGNISVDFKAYYQGKAIKLNASYYCALFLDEGLKNRYTAAGVKCVTMSKDQEYVYGRATFENIPAGTYYAAQTNANGEPLGDNATFKVSNPNTALHLSSRDLEAEIVVNYQKEPAEYTYASAEEIQRSNSAQYANYGGSAAAAAQLASGEGSVKTGDTTNIAMYVGILAATLLIIILIIFVKKKKK